jgi:hypothetical protein
MCVLPRKRSRINTREFKEVTESPKIIKAKRVFTDAEHDGIRYVNTTSETKQINIRYFMHEYEKK